MKCIDLKDIMMLIILKKIFLKNLNENKTLKIINLEIVWMKKL